MRWIRWAKSLISTLADALKGIFDEKGHFTSTMVEMETCTYCVRSAIHQKREAFYEGVTVPSLFLFWRGWCVWTLSFSQVPWRSHVNLSSHLREAQALGVIMTYCGLPMGRGCAWHTHACTWTHINVASTPLYCKLAEQSPHSSPPHTVPAADWGGSASHNAMVVVVVGGALQGHCQSCWKPGYPSWALGLSG